MDIAPAYAGIASGFISTAAGLAAIVSPVAFGVITDMTGSYRVPFVMSIALLLVGIVLSFWIRPDRPLQGSATPKLSTKSLGVHS
jgi:nitrate/nitrite transporter NarK